MVGVRPTCSGGSDATLPDTGKRAACIVVVEGMATLLRHSRRVACCRSRPRGRTSPIDMFDKEIGVVATCGAGLPGLVDRIDGLGGRSPIDPLTQGTRIAAEVACAVRTQDQGPLLRKGLWSWSSPRASRSPGPPGRATGRRGARPRRSLSRRCAWDLVHRFQHCSHPSGGRAFRGGAAPPWRITQPAANGGFS